MEQHVSANFDLENEIISVVRRDPGIIQKQIIESFDGKKSHVPIRNAIKDLLDNQVLTSVRIKEKNYQLELYVNKGNPLVVLQEEFMKIKEVIEPLKKALTRYLLRAYKSALRFYQGYRYRKYTVYGRLFDAEMLFTFTLDLLSRLAPRYLMTIITDNSELTKRLRATAIFEIHELYSSLLAVKESVFAELKGSEEILLEYSNENLRQLWGDLLRERQDIFDTFKRQYFFKDYKLGSEFSAFQTSIENTVGHIARGKIDVTDMYGNEGQMRPSYYEDLDHRTSVLVEKLATSRPHVCNNIV